MSRRLCLSTATCALPILISIRREQILNLLQQLRLIGLHRQEVVRAAAANRRGRLLLAVHRVERHDSPFQIEQFQQFHHRRNLIRLLVDGDLAQG